MNDLRITLTVDSNKMKNEIVDLVNVKNLCTICQFREQPNLANKKVCEICENHNFWRLHPTVEEEIEAIITRNVDVGW